MNFTLKKLAQYCVEHSSIPTEVLSDLERDTHLKTLSPQMLSGQLQGQLLAIISKLVSPNRILEIGTFTGYATICLAQGLRAGGKITTLESNAELKHIYHKYFEKAGITSVVDPIIVNAREWVKTISDYYDLVFIDAGKQDYAYYYDCVFDHVVSGGVIIIDNTLWSGKVVSQHQDNDTRIMHEFNKKVSADDRVEKIILPIRDGITIIRKK